MTTNGQLKSKVRGRSSSPRPRFGGEGLGVRGRPGIMLTEAIVAIMALSIAMLVGTAILLGALKVQRAASAAGQRLTQRGLLEDEFRADVAQADAAPDSLEKVKAGPTCLILYRHNGEHVIYRWEDKRLERSDSTAGGSRRQVALGPDCQGMEFLREGTARRLITLRLTEARGFRQMTRTTDISAALGGDLR